MKGYLYLVLVLVVFSPVVFGADFDTNIYVNPFIFGTIKGDTGDVLQIYPSSFTQGNFSQIITSEFESISPITHVIKNNSLLILKLPSDNSYKMLKRSPGMGKFSIIYNTVDYPQKNINVLFRVD